MTAIPEPHRKVSTCIYCGDSHVPHALYFFASLPSVIFDTHVIKTTKHAPIFVRDFVDWLFLAFFELSLWLHISKLSDDINLTNTFRSRVVWEEAKRRGIDMKQVIMFGKPLDLYRTRIRGKLVYFDSLPIPPERMIMKNNWDDKFLLKQELSKNDVPVPKYFSFSVFSGTNLEEIFNKFQKPIIVKPRVGSRGRHTVTNIHTFLEFKKGVDVVKQLCAYVAVEEHLQGDVCRATFVDGKLMGFYRGISPYVIGDGIKTIDQLIQEKDDKRNERVEKVQVNNEMKDYVARLGFNMSDVLPAGIRLSLTYRTGRLFGGATREMLDELHPSFVPILTKAAKIVDLPVLGFDCIVPEPTKDANAQRWGIIECNTLPFIDLHYYALEGKPKNIAGAIWDMWN